MIRLGLCCGFVNAPIKFRTTTVTHLTTLQERDEDVYSFLHTIVEENLDSLKKAITFCSQNGIGAFRINSALIPAATHPQWRELADQLFQSKQLLRLFQAASELASAEEIRLSFHPDQFVILNSPREDVVDKSIAELDHHGRMAALLGADVINIHGGGGYGDKKNALRRIIENFDRLSEEARTRLTFENDDKIYTPADLLPVCRELGIPLVYDVHHHRCLQDELTIDEATDAALESWNRPPLFHISSPKNGWQGPQTRLHSDDIAIDDFPKRWLSIPNLTVDVEAKAKELAVLKLLQEIEDMVKP